MEGHKDLKVFRLSYKLAMEICEVTRTFPREERSSVTDPLMARQQKPRFGSMYRWTVATLHLNCIAVWSMITAKLEKC
jgi:hypothetical protein